MAVSNPHPEYQKYLPVWARTRDAVKGSRAVKEKKHQYLPVPDNTSGDEAKGTETIRYRQYIKRAVYTNFTGRTKNALVGAAFRKQPDFVLPDQLGYLLQDATGDGLSLVQLAKDELSNLLETGRTSFLVDYPATDENLSAEQVARMSLQATIIPYTAEQVVNWRTDNVNGRRLLVLVVLAENYSVQKDEFDHTADVQYRVLRLREDGYTTQIYRDDEPYTEESYPTKADGSRWEEIPFQFVGAKN